MAPLKPGWQLIALDLLVPAPWNYKANDEALAEKLLANVEKNGQVENLVVREIEPERFEVVNGNHRLPVFCRAKIDPAMCYNCGPVGVEEAIVVALELNETRFPVDQVRLLARIGDLLPQFDRDDLAQSLPFPTRDFDRMIKATTFDWGAVKKAGPMAGDGPAVSPASLKVDLPPAYRLTWEKAKEMVVTKTNAQNDSEVFIYLLALWEGNGV